MGGADTQKICARIVCGEEESICVLFTCQLHKNNAGWRLVVTSCPGSYSKTVSDVGDGG
jgi:hypothetical protein